MSIHLLRWAKLYSDATPAERSLEPAVASMGRPYRFQHALFALGVFPDFALIHDKVVIEVDDPSHNTARRRKADAERTRKLEAHGWRVLRCTNEEALEDPYGTVTRLMKAADLPYRPKRKRAQADEE